MSAQVGGRLRLTPTVCVMAKTRQHTGVPTGSQDQDQITLWNGGGEAALRNASESWMFKNRVSE